MQREEEAEKYKRYADFLREKRKGLPTPAPVPELQKLYPYEKFSFEMDKAAVIEEVKTAILKRAADAPMAKPLSYPAAPLEPPIAEQEPNELMKQLEKMRKGKAPKISVRIQIRLSEFSTQVPS